MPRNCRSWRSARSRGWWSTPEACRPRATELANRLAQQIGSLSEDDLARMLAILDEADGA